ncbi:rCG55086 [Rattus norvegicus]|uniref:RCG55086 n=1 Tax=Rattus norvegicus TaxID=10116 RepID=A6IJD1_RAT|nr:rCG55086 [Rattus norvegicus]
MEADTAKQETGGTSFHLVPTVPAASRTQPRTLRDMTCPVGNGSWFYFGLR